jgi:hypothetical protein
MDIQPIPSMQVISPDIIITVEGRGEDGLGEWRLERWRMTEFVPVSPSFCRSLGRCSQGHRWFEYQGERIIQVGFLYFRRVALVA